MSGFLKASRQPPDNIDEYRQEFGYLGPALHGAVSRGRVQTQSTAQSASSSLTTAAGELSLGLWKQDKLSKKLGLPTWKRYQLNQINIFSNSFSWLLGGNLTLASAGRNTLMVSGASSSKVLSGAGATAINSKYLTFLPSHPTTSVQVYWKT